MSKRFTPGTPVRSGEFHGVVLDPATEAIMPAPTDGRDVRVRWEFDGNPSYSVTWERAADLENDDDR